MKTGLRTCQPRGKIDYKQLRRRLITDFVLIEAGKKRESLSTGTQPHPLKLCKSIYDTSKITKL